MQRRPTSIKIRLRDEVSSALHKHEKAATKKTGVFHFTVGGHRVNYYSLCRSVSVRWHEGGIFGQMSGDEGDSNTILRIPRTDCIAFPNGRTRQVRRCLANTDIARLGRCLVSLVAWRSELALRLVRDVSHDVISIHLTSGKERTSEISDIGAGMVHASDRCVIRCMTTALDSNRFV